MFAEKVVEEEEKQKLSSEKFNKLKVMYTQIRDEHINLLRQVRHILNYSIYNYNVQV